MKPKSAAHFQARALILQAVPTMPNQKRRRRQMREPDAVEASRIKRAKRQGNIGKCARVRIRPESVEKRRRVNPKLMRLLGSGIGVTRVAGKKKFCEDSGVVMAA